MEVGYSTIALVSLLLVVAVSSSGCPPWFTLDITNNSAFPQCVCSQTLQSIITCNQKERTSYIKVGYCAYYDNKRNESVVAVCPYIYPLHLIQNGLIRLPHNLTQLNTFTCGQVQRETGPLLCGKCTNGTGPSIYSYGSQCAKCSTMNILYYLLLVYVPNTVIFLVIIIFRYSAISPTMGHYIFYGNIVQIFMRFYGQYAFFVTSNPNIRQIIKYLLILNSLWTLDPLYFISPPLCVSEKFQEIYIPLIDIVSALYPFALLILTYILIEMHAKDFKCIVAIWKVCSKCGYVKSLSSQYGNKSLVQTLTTLFILTLMKFIRIISEFTFVIDVQNMQGNIEATLIYTDPSVALFSHKHLQVIFFAVSMAMFILFPPTLLLLLYPTRCYKRFSTCLKPRLVLTLKIFSDTFYNGFKDGTDGARDYRPIAGLPLTLCVLFAPFGEIVRIILGHPISWLVLFIPMAMLFIIAFVVLEPYKQRSANMSAILIILAVTTIASITAILETYKASMEMELSLVAVLTLPHCVFYGYGIYRLVKWTKECVYKMHQDDERPLIGSAHCTELTSSTRRMCI